MKKVMMPAAYLMIAGLVACNSADNSSENTADSISATTVTESETSVATGSADLSNRKFVDLYSGSEVKVQKDEQKGYYINAETQKPIDFYVDPSTNDTFDMRGRIVNMALVNSGGKYYINEAKIKVQSDNDLIIKDTENDTKIKLEPNGDTKVKTEEFKEKTKGDKYKYKDDDVTIKVKDGEVKVKD